MFENTLLDKIPAQPAETITEGPLEKVQTLVMISVMFSWTCWIPLLMSAKGLIDPYKLNITGDIVGFFLYIAAMTGMWIVVVALMPPENRIGQLKEKFAILGKWKKNLHWYPVAILIPLMVELIGPGIYSIAGGNVQGLSAATNWQHVAILLVLGIHFAIVLMLAGAGYLLPLLNSVFERRNASIIATVLTMVWMLPMIMLVVIQSSSYSMIAYVAEFTPLALALFWLYYTARTD
ncbi:hypothetical protein [Methanocella sp. MCL-LM]|uniref:hypothetical protein n=1 Tax=Methanocella sp. MCL-LM TaxID=3412035 RepID=UPI003C75EECB